MLSKLSLARLAAAFLLLVGVPLGALDTIPSPGLDTRFGRVALPFEPNRGQVEGAASFVARGIGFELSLTPSSAYLLCRPPEDPGEGFPLAARSSFTLRWLGARPGSETAGEEPLPGQSHYVFGNDPARWIREVPHFARVRTRDLYPGIDLVYYSTDGRLQYDLIVAPGADPRIPILALEGIDRMEIDRQGDAILSVAGVHHRLSAPVVYQEIDGARRHVAGRFVRKGRNRLGFRVGRYDRTRPLVIDPVIYFSTFLCEGLSQDVAVDAAGNVYLAVEGYVNFVSALSLLKLDPTGTRILYALHLSDGSGPGGRGVAVDGNGHLWVTGGTGSPNLPTVNPIQPNLAGFIDAFVAKLDGQGNLVYSTYLGGNDADEGNGIAVDPSGAVYVVGASFSDSFDALTSLRPKGAFEDGFIAKLDPDGRPVYFTFLGGGFNGANEVAADAGGNAYVAGWTAHGDLPNPVGSYRANSDALVMKLNPQGSPVFSVYLGGSDFEHAQDVAVHPSGEIYVAGWTGSPDFPTAHPYQASTLSGFDAFVAKLDSQGALLYSTYLGGAGGSQGTSIDVDARGDAYVTGVAGRGFPTTSNALQPSIGGGSDAFLARIDPSLSGPASLVYSSYLGGSGVDVGWALAVDPFGDVYITGMTGSADFPLVKPLHDEFPWDLFEYQAFVLRMGNGFCPDGSVSFHCNEPFDGADIALAQELGPEPVTSGSILTSTLTVTNRGPGNADGVVVRQSLPSSLGLLSCAATGAGVCAPEGEGVTITFGPLERSGSEKVTLAVSVSCSLAGETPLAVTANVHAESVDPDSGNDSAATTLQILNPAPVLSCPPDHVAATDPGQCSAALSLVPASATDNCPGVGVTATRSDGEPLGAPFPLGSTDLGWLATDSGGASESCVQRIAVEDQEGPALLDVRVDRPLLWPPDHSMVEVNVGYEARDNCGAPSCALAVASNEPHEASSDWEILDPHRLRLRAERSPQAGGRIYTVTISCTDAAGHSMQRDVTVTVPVSISEG